MDRVILDTDVSSVSLKRRLPSPALTRLIGKQPCITFVTLGPGLDSADSAEIIEQRGGQGHVHDRGL